MTERLRVGVLGLGRRWRRCLALLPQLRGVLEVVAVADPRPGRARRAARAAGCAAADGVTDLLERDDVAAVLLADAPWYGLWPLEVAARLGKPVLCAASLAAEADADALHRTVRDAGLPVLMGLPGAEAASLARLTALLGGAFGLARLVRAECVLRAPEGRQVGGADLLAGGALLGTLHAAARLLAGTPRGVRAVTADGFPLVTLLLDAADGCAAQVTVWADRLRGGRWRVEAVTPRGAAAAEGPRQLRWRTAEGEQRLRLPRRPPLRGLLERFARGVPSGQALRPDLTDAYRALRLLRAARQSLAEGRRVAVEDP